MRHSFGHWAMAIVLSIGLSASLPASGNAQSEDIQSLITQAGDLRSDGQSQDALVLFDEALELARQQDGEDSPLFRRVQRNRALCLYDLGRPEDAADILKAHIHIAESLPPNQRNEFAVDYELLSAIREKAGAIPEALSLMDRAITSQSDAAVPQDKLRRLVGRVRLSMAVADFDLAARSLRGVLELNETENLLPEGGVPQVYQKLLEVHRAAEAYSEAKAVVREHLAYLLDTGEHEQSLRLAELYTELGLLSLMEESYDEAATHFERTLTIFYAVFDEPNYYFVRHLDNLAYAATLAFNNKLAADAAAKALEIAETTIDETEEQLATRRKDTANHLLLAGELGRAQPLFERVLADLGENGPGELDLLWNLAAIHYLKNDEPAYQTIRSRILTKLAETNYAITEVGREGYWAIPTNRSHLALVKLDVALRLIDEETEIEDSERLDWMSASANALMIHDFVEKAGERIEELSAFVQDRFGKDDWNFARVLELQSQFAVRQNKYQDAKTYIEDAIALRQRLVLGSGSADTILEFGNDQAYQQIAMIYAGEDKLAQAIQYATLALTTAERSYGADSAFTVPYVLHLADLQVSAGNVDAGKTLLDGLLSATDRPVPLSKQEILLARSVAAQIALRRGDRDEALALVDDTLKDIETVYWHSPAVIAETLLQKADILTGKGDYERSLDALERAVNLLDKDRNPVLYATALFERGKVRNLSLTRNTPENLDKAYQDFSGVIEIEESMIGEDRALSIRAHHALAGVAFQQRRLDLATEHAEKSTQLAQKRIELAKGVSGFSEKLSIETYRSVFMKHIRILALQEAATEMSDATFEQAVYGTNDAGFTPTALPITRADFAKAFLSAQWVGEVSVSNAIQNVSDRLADGGGELAGLIRDQQDKRFEIEKLRNDLLDMVVQPPVSRDANRESELILRIGKTRSQLESLNDRIATEYPNYSDKVLPGVVPLEKARALLNEDEALILYRFDEVGGAALLLTPEDETLLALDINRAELENQVEGIRESLTFGARGPRRYANRAAHKLYQAIFEPFMPLLENTRNIILSVDDPLLRFPFEALVVDAQQKALRTDDDYAATNWLGDHFAFTVTPSVQVLRALRQQVQSTADQPSIPFIGVGDPVLGTGDFDPGRRGKPRKLANGLADPSELHSMPPLPETADELHQMAGYYGPDGSVLYLGENASEEKLRGGALQSARILVFATHGTLAQDIGNVDEPALVLTPPSEATPENDGLLTASEIALEKLQADLVLLSACNTSASDGRFLSTGLSGLAKSFFYAGTKSLLVSHWPIESEATVALTTGILERITTDPTVSVAEAVRIAARKFRTDPALRKYAHPVYWAPFSVIGG